jgi:hypothetical protein
MSCDFVYVRNAHGYDHGGKVRMRIEANCTHANGLVPGKEAQHEDSAVMQE